MQQLTAQDASFLYNETPNAPMSGGGLNIYDPSTAPGGKVTFKALMQHIEDRLHLATPFRQRVVRVPFDADHPYWIQDTDFDIEFHVRHIALPEPGDWRQLCIQCARLISRHLDPSKPLWEFYVIDGLDRVPGYPKGCFGILSKVHHACIDGASGTELTAAIHDRSNEATPPQPPTEAWKGERVPDPAELLARAAWTNATQPWRMMELFTGPNAPARRLAEVFARPGGLPPVPGAAPLTRFNAPVSPHRVVDGIMVELDDIRAMRTLAPGCTVNDVVLALVGGALREYLEAKDELPRESLTAMCPISVRTEGSSSGNEVSAMVVPLRTDIADPRVRLLTVRDATKAAKELTNAIGARTLTDLNQFVPAATAALAGRLAATQAIGNERIAPPYNTVVTNIPGPQEPLFMAGAQLVAMYGFGMVHDNMGLMNVVASYCGGVSICGTADRKMLPDPAFYAQCLQRSFDELRKAAGEE